ncbi:MAG: hypothetical protein JXB47_13650 [Anaerolineae bacterium]|nr:hypothetical protein [Anaerolineae bacterium]
MASGVTNKGKYSFLDLIFRATALATNLYLALVTSANTPDAGTNTMSDLTRSRPATATPVAVTNWRATAPTSTC